LIGSGGFADVYLYAQTLPRRNVAIKVLIPDATDDEVITQFDAEANLMAALSTHPAIVTIYQAGVAPDGRPYLVMEYCSRPNLAARYRAERLSVAEVLRIGVRIAGAVETAHRAGILHRDIKPANVLTTDFGHPVLSDFGISVSRSSPRGSAGTAAVGMSIPWTAPEMFVEGATGDERADVYSLAATLYTVLARRSPFDRPGGPNRSADLIGRIRNSPVPPLGRSDVPPSLERLLSRAMDKNPAARNASALEFARGLQRVETEMRLAPTPVDVLAEHPDDVPTDPEDGVATRIRSLTVIDPAPDPSAGSSFRGVAAEHASFAPGANSPLATPPVASASAPSMSPGWPSPVMPPSGSRPDVQSGLDGGQGDDDTVRRSAPGINESHPATRSGRRGRIPLLVGGGALVAVAALVVVLVLTRGGRSPAPPDHTGDTLTTLTSGNDPIGGAVPLPSDLTGEGTGVGVTFTWRNPEPRAGDAFQWYQYQATNGDTARHTTTETTATVLGSGRLCIAVVLVRADGTSSPQPATACATSQRGAS
jgi:serine/threonine protein kinase